jgi:hypothetical protein
VLRPGDSHCAPTGGTRSRTWHWNGRRFTASRWTATPPNASQRTAVPSGRAEATFYWPGRAVNCEMNDGRPGVGSNVFCESYRRPHSVEMGLNGRLKICRGGTIMTTHCLGNPGLNTPVLAYGQHIALRHFRCASRRSGVTCTVRKTGKGFRINSRGVQRVG